jgi:hypothetical protein
VSGCNCSVTISAYLDVVCGRKWGGRKLLDRSLGEGGVRGRYLELVKGRVRRCHYGLPVLQEFLIVFHICGLFQIFYSVVLC